MLALGWLIAGGVLGLLLAPWSIRRGRRAVAGAGAIVQWEERVVPPWRQDPVQALFIAVHGAAVLCLAVLRAISAWQAPYPAQLTSSPSDLVLGMLAGAVVGFPLAARLGPAMPMALYPEGVIRGRFVSEWAAYSHFVPDPGSGLIRLYSQRTPEVARVAWHPPTQPVFLQAMDVLARHLPTAPPSASPWYRRRAAFLAAGLLVILPGLVGGLLVLRAGVRWAPLYYAGTAYLICIAGIRLIRSYQVD